VYMCIFVRGVSCLLINPFPQELHYFLVTAIHVVPNVIMVTCDGCGTRINNNWYRSLEVSENCDLCETCFNGEFD